MQTSGEDNWQSRENRPEQGTPACHRTFSLAVAGTRDVNISGFSIRTRCSSLKR
jgi:hypothetical protein